MMYLRERLTVIPWAVIPSALYLLSRGTSESFDASLLGFLYAIVFLLRVVDDFFCFSHDRECGKPAAYLRYTAVRLLPWIIVFALASVGMAYMALPWAAFVATTLFLAVHPPIYRMLRGRRVLLGVSMAKYPFLLFMVAGLSGQPDFWWPAFGTVFFLLREAVEEIGGLRSRRIETSVVGLLILTRLLLPLA